MSKKVKKKICKTCGEDIVSNSSRGVPMFDNTYHQKQAKDYCKDHTTIYSDHTCKPVWCGDCGFLTKYEIEVQKGK